MNSSNFPTRRNLLDAKQSLNLAKQGYDLLDKKRTVLLMELNSIKKKSQLLYEELEKILQNANENLTQAQTFMGEKLITKICNKIEIDTSLEICFKNIMGVGLPQISKNNASIQKPPYPLGESTTYLDSAYASWINAEAVILKYAEAKISIIRLTKEIYRTQKRASALRNIKIPEYETRIKYISEQLEERERDERIRIRNVFKKHESF